MFSALWNKLKELVYKMIRPQTIENTLHIAPAISSKMANAIELWSDMYEGNSYWIKNPTLSDPTKIVSLGLPSLIASEKARMAVLEMKSEITAPISDGDEYEVSTSEFSPTSESVESSGYIVSTERAKYLNERYKKLLSKIRIQLEYGIAKGGLVIKPYLVKNESANPKLKPHPQIEFDYVQADAFFPISFDGSGKVTEAAFIQRKVDKDIIYSRLEYHKIEGTTVTVQNRAYKNTNKSQGVDYNSNTDLGVEISLTDVSEWKDIQPITIINDVDRLLFAYFRVPEANTIDSHSPLGVSGYSRAVNLIKEADMQYSRLLWEFEGGELAIDVDRDALREVTDHDGSVHTVRPMLQNRLYRTIDLGDEYTYNVFSPALRDASLINGLNTILMRIEDVCSLSRGTISNIDSTQAKTATELRILKQRSYQANLEIQKQLQSTLEDVVYIMDVYCSLYGVTPEGEYEVSFEWDDSIIVDANEELTKRIMLKNNQIDSRLELRMWYHGETERQAKEALKKVDEEATTNAETQAKISQIQNPNAGGETIQTKAERKKDSAINSGKAVNTSKNPSPNVSNRRPNTDETNTDNKMK